jgi:hypothetical protein
VTAGGPDIDLIIEFLLLDFVTESLGYRLAAVGVTSRAVTDGDNRFLGISFGEN